MPRILGGNREDSSRNDLNDSIRARYQLKKNIRPTPIIDVTPDSGEQISISQSVTAFGATTTQTVTNTLTQEMIVTQFILQAYQLHTGSVSGDITIFLNGTQIMAYSTEVSTNVNKHDLNLIIPIPNWILSVGSTLRLTITKSGGSGNYEANVVWIGYKNK